MAIPISYSEVYGEKPTDHQFDDLISSFSTDPTFLSLAMWDLMISLFEGNIEKYKYLQGFFIRNLIRQDCREHVLRLADLDSELPRPVFGRWQLLALMKRLLLVVPTAGEKDPRTDDSARRMLGDACLMMNDLLFPEEQMARFEKIVGVDKRERIHDELMTQWIPQFELLYVPDVFQAVARNDEYLNIFDRRAAEFKFANGQTLEQRFKQLTGLEIRQYLRLYFALHILHIQLQDRHPDEINADPGIINFDKKRSFSTMDFETEEMDIFFRQAVTDLPSIIEGIKRDVAAGRAWQSDFTTFRDHPLVSIPGNEQGFTCIAFPFLIEKLASGIYHTILNSWEEGDAERSQFQAYWGKVFEQFINDRLSEQYPSSILSNRLYANPYFKKKKNRSIEVSDSVLDYGDSLILIEHKGGYLSLEEKYSDDVDELLKGVAKKFGLDRGIKQLSRAVEMLFNEDPTKRGIFSELDEKRRDVRTFTSADVGRVRKVYPVLVVQDFSMANGFLNRRLRMQFALKLNEYSIDTNVHVRPLSLLTIENLENILAHLDELTLTEILDEYANERHEPLSTFNSIFDEFLKAKGSDVKRRYKWSVKRGEAILNGMLARFIVKE